MQNENVGTLFKNYQEFQDDGSKVLDQVWGSSGCRAFCNYTGHMPVKPALHI